MFYGGTSRRVARSSVLLDAIVKLQLGQQNANNFIKIQQLKGLSKKIPIVIFLFWITMAPYVVAHI